MLPELEALLRYHSPSHVEKFKLKYLQWLRHLVRLLSEAEKMEKWRNTVDLERPLESMYYIAMETPQVTSLSACPRGEWQEREEELKKLKQENFQLQSFKEKWEQAEKHLEELKATTLQLATLQVKYDYLKHSNDLLSQHLISLQNSNDRNLFAMAFLNSTPMPFEPGDKLQQLMKTFSSNNQLLMDCDASAPSSCAKCTEVATTQDKQLKWYEEQQNYMSRENAQLRGENQKLYLTMQKLEMDVNVFNEINAACRIQNTYFISNQLATNRYNDLIADLRAQLTQTIAEKYQLVSLSPPTNDVELDLTKTKLDTLLRSVNEFLLSSDMSTENLARVYQEIISSTNSVFITEEMDVDQLKIVNKQLTYELATKEEIEPEIVELAKKYLPMIKNIFHISHLNDLSSVLEDVESMWGNKLYSGLQVLKSHHIYEATLSGLTELLTKISTFTATKGIPDQLVMMDRLFQTLQDYGGLQFMEHLHYYKPIVKNTDIFIFVLKNVYNLLSDHTISLNTLFSFILEVFQSLKNSSEELTLSTIRKTYIKSLYATTIQEADVLDEVSMDEIIQGYLRDKKRPRC